MTKTYPISEAQFAEAKNLIRNNGGTIREDLTFEIRASRGASRGRTAR